MNDIERKRQELEEEWICRECGDALSVAALGGGICEECRREIDGPSYGDDDVICEDCQLPLDLCECWMDEPIDDIDANTRGDIA